MTEMGPSAPEKVPALQRYNLASGALWSLGGFGFGQFLRLLSNIILTRLLFPEAFGIMALAMVMITGVATLSDLGIRASLIQNPDAENRRFLDTAWTLGLIRGGVLFLLVWAGSIPFAAYYDTPELGYLVPLIATRLLIDSFGTTKLLMYRRHVKVKQIALIDLFAQIAGLAVMVPLAWYFESVWTLAISGIVHSSGTMVASYLIPGKNNRICWDMESARQIYHFGRWILLSTALNFADSSADRLIFGKLVSLAALGVYNIGASMAAIGNQVINRISTSLIFPVLSRANEEGGEIGPQFRRIRKPILVVAAWGSSILVAGGAPLMHTLYDPSYAASGWILQFLAAGYWFRAPFQMNQVTLLALGDSRWVAGLNAAKVLAMVTLIPIGWAMWEFPGAVAAIAGAEFVRYVFSLVATHRHGIQSVAEDMRYTAQVAAAAAGGLWLSDWMHQQSIHTALNFLAVAGGLTLLWSPELVPAALQFRRRHNRERA